MILGMIIVIMVWNFVISVRILDLLFRVVVVLVRILVITGGAGLCFFPSTNNKQQQTTKPRENAHFGGRRGRENWKARCVEHEHFGEPGGGGVGDPVC